MSTFTDLEKDAVSVDGFVNENALIQTRRNGPKPSYQYLVDGWNNEFNAEIDLLKGSQGFYDAGTFASGFTYEKFNDVGRDNSGNPWIYIGDESNYPVTVAAGTDPSAFPSLYAQRGYDDHASLANLASDDAHPSRSITNSDQLTAQDTHDATKAILIAQGLSGNYGFFTKGFTYNETGDAGIDAIGNIYTYAGGEELPVNVVAATNPAGDGDYKLFTQKGFISTTSDSVSSLNLFLGSKVVLLDMESAVYQVVTSSDTGGFYLMTLPNGNKLKYVPGFVQQPEHFGAVGDPDNIVDESTALRAFFKFSRNGFLTSGKVYGSTLSIPLYSNSEIHGKGEIRQLSESGNILTATSISNFNIYGGKITSNILTQASGYTSNGLLCSSCSDFSVSGLDILVTEYTHGIKLLQCTNFDIHSNTISGDGSFDVSENGRTLSDGVAVLDGSNNGKVRLNKVSNVGHGVNLQSIASNADIHDVEVSFNNIKDISGYGILSYRLNSLIYSVQITHNHIENVYGTFYNTATSSYTHGAGIYLQTVDNHDVNYNTVINTCIKTNSESLSPAGISCAYTTVGEYGGNHKFIGNDVRVSGRYGMLIDGVDNMCRDNEVRDAVRGSFYSRGSKNLKVYNLKTYTNENYGGMQFTSVAGSLARHDNLLIVDAELSNSSVGISLDGVFGANIVRPVINSSSAETFFQGITSTNNISNIDIDKAIVNCNGGVGIRLQGTSNKVTNSQIYGNNSGEGIQIGKKVRNYLDNNTVEIENILEPLFAMENIAESEITLPWYGRDMLLNITTTGVIDRVSSAPKNSTLTVRAPTGVTIKNMSGSAGFRFRFFDSTDRVTTKLTTFVFKVYFNGVLECVSEF